uniref:Uncharacterized protein n=1 Tax=Lepeophtheirus salmonis TaxID=72036 RepID=A0A0K2UJK4_LEPSM
MADSCSASMRSSSSSDPNPLDFEFWGYFKKNVSHTSHPNLGFLQAAIMVGWYTMITAFIVNLFAACRGYYCLPISWIN